MDGFDWDDGNRAKCGRHGVSLAEIEGLFRAGATVILPDVAHSAAEKRLIVVGRSAEGRPLFVAYTLRERDGRRLVRPISARYMHRKEIERFEQEDPKVRDR